MCVDANGKKYSLMEKNILRQAGSHARPCSAPRGPHWPHWMWIQSPHAGVHVELGRLEAVSHKRKQLFSPAPFCKRFRFFLVSSVRLTASNKVVRIKSSDSSHSELDADGLKCSALLAYPPHSAELDCLRPLRCSLCRSQGAYRPNANFLCTLCPAQHLNDECRRNPTQTLTSSRRSMVISPAPLRVGFCLK